MTRSPSPTQSALLPLTALTLLIILGALIVYWPHDSLWYDESLTTYVATDSWATLWNWVTQVDIQVPFHYILLRLWVGVAGDSEIALRALSALCIPLAAAATVAAARRLVRSPAARGTADRRGHGIAVGLVAALLLAILPGALWIAYEVRAYATAIACFAWATAFLVILIDRARHGRPVGLPLTVGYAALMLATLYTHYTALAGFAAHAAVIGLEMLAILLPATRRADVRSAAWRKLVRLAAPPLLVILGFAPWVPVVLARGATDRSYYEGAIPFERSLSVMAGFKVLGRQDEPAVALPLIAGYAALLGLGLITGLLNRSLRRAALIGLILAALPLALTILLLYINPKLTGRYFWPAWFGLDLLAALALAGIAGLLSRPFTRRALSPALPALLAIALTLGLIAVPYATGERGSSPDSDYRAAFAHLCTQGTPDDVILLRDGTLFVAEHYYGRRPPCDTPRRTVGMPDSLITDVTRYLDLGTLQGKMLDIARLTPPPPNVWVLSWQGDIMDPQALSYALLDAAGQHTEQARQFGDVRLDRYERIDAAALERLATDGPLPQAQWFNLKPVADGPTLIALRLFAPETARAGDTIVVQAWWERGTVLQPDLRGSARLTTTDGGWLYAQADQPPAGWKFYDDRWTPGIPAFGRYELTVGPDVPAGRVAVRYAVYDALNRWPPVVIPLGEVVVVRP